MEKEILNRLNDDLNELMIKVGFGAFQSKDKAVKQIIQKLKNDIMNAQNTFVKSIELFYL